MWWREVKELAGMVLLAHDVPSVEQPVEAEVFQAFGSTEPVGSPDFA